MKIEEAFARFIEEEVLIYAVSQGGSVSATIECTVKEIGDGWVRIAQEDNTESIVNIANIIRIREYPRGKNGKKKIVFD